MFGAAVLLACAGLATLPSQALAWANGPNERNSFGTHDWVLDNALRIAGEEGGLGRLAHRDARKR